MQLDLALAAQSTLLNPVQGYVAAARPLLTLTVQSRERRARALTRAAFPSIETADQIVVPAALPTPRPRRRWRHGGQGTATGSATASRRRTRDSERPSRPRQHAVCTTSLSNGSLLALSRPSFSRVGNSCSLSPSHSRELLPSRSFSAPSSSFFLSSSPYLFLCRLSRQLSCPLSDVSATHKGAGQGSSRPPAKTADNTDKSSMRGARPIRATPVYICPFLIATLAST